VKKLHPNIVAQNLPEVEKAEIIFQKPAQTCMKL